MITTNSQRAKRVTLRCTVVPAARASFVRGLLNANALVLLFAGMPSVAAAQAQHSGPTEHKVTPVATGPTLSLKDAVSLALGDQPTIEAFGREAEASEEAAVAAGTLPDPELMVGVRDFPVTGNKAFSPTADNFTMYMVGAMREQVRRSTRVAEASRLRAEALVSRAQGTAQERRIRREVMMAWINAVEARAKQRLLDRLIADLRVGHQVMEAVIPTGGSTPALALQMQAEIALAQARQTAARGEEGRARADLARWIGSLAKRPLPDVIPTLELPPGIETTADLDDHPAVEVAEAQEQAAQRQVDVARAERNSNISWSVSYGWRPEFGDLVTAQVTIPLQINRAGRQNRRIAEAGARAEAARLRGQDTQRELSGAYGAALAQYKSAEAQLSILSSQAIPSLEASFAAAEARYGAGQGTLEMPLTIIERYVETSVQAVEERARRARAAAELIYLTQDVAR